MPGNLLYFCEYIAASVPCRAVITMPDICASTGCQQRKLQEFM